MPLNIKDEEVHRKAKALAAATGRTITAAVADAIDEKLARLEQTSPPTQERTVEAILAIGREVAAYMPKGAKSSDHAELYDEHGLPK
ncbi:MAG: type II toxin-antitoxin system VapB family antitoxin [Rhodospirillaceae bacterium]|nr:type II toxin-antitoxin system VapB family antitoxin [Rhodospirillaceae bacterium]MCA8933976.1 type II toxin-antitoxin system VapB family antitoxin [Rhodospirillaceae bacterium]